YPGEHRTTTFVEQHTGRQPGHGIPVGGQAYALLALVDGLVHGVEGIRQVGKLVASGVDHGLVLPPPGDELARRPVERQDALAHRPRGHRDGEDAAEAERTEGNGEDHAIFLEQGPRTDVATRHRADQRDVRQRLQLHQAYRIRIVPG